MHPFHEAVTLRMIRRSLDVGDAQQGGELAPQTGRELAATISDDGRRDAVTGDPCSEKVREH